MNEKFHLKSFKIIPFLFLILFAFNVNAQVGFSADTVKSQKYDTGKMWTFEFPPFEYLKQVYNFAPDQQWFDNVRLSALRIPGCTASFVSGDGLIMTNNHCARGYRRFIQKEGEDIAKNGFYAPTLADERKVQNFTAEQLVYLKDVTNEVAAALKAGKNEKEKINLRDAKMKELKEKYDKETNLKCDVISYYNGSLFFVQGFKTYTDVRLVFEPEETIAYFGGDPDNFTFPRYNLDCTFFRIYDDNGKPIKSDHYFKWSANGASSNELVFTVGNPGTTNRLRTAAQLEYMRDVQYRNSSYLADKYYAVLDQLKTINPAKADDYETLRLSFSNSQKNISNTFKALNDPYLLARKKDFEKKVRDYVNSSSELQKEYGHVWKTIETTRNELRKIDTKLAAFSVNPIYFSRYMVIANYLVTDAKNKSLPEDQKQPLPGQFGPGGGQRGGQNLRDNLYPDNLDKILEEAKLEINIDYIIMNLGKDDPLVKEFFSGKSIKETANNLISKTVFKDKASVQDLLKKTPEEIYALDDPFIQYYVKIHDKAVELRKQQKEVMDTENVAFGMLGQILYKMYGTSITPDANRTLRISDGVLKGYEYNGTVAPVKSTYFGLYDRYYGFEGKYPFNLSQRWQNALKDFDLSTPFNFVSTNDIVGGNSGSAIINKNAEIIGLAFDGNIESLQGNFIYLSKSNRTVGVDSKGMWEGIKKVYKADRLADELKEGKMK